jgi:MoxR-like ATPase
MSYPYYSDTPKPTTAVELPLSQYQQQTAPENYLPDKGLVDAVNVALMLGQPLLLTGEAGAGKTQLAYHLALQLGLGEPLKFNTKSDSKAKDLFYLYDYLAHFHAAQNKQQAQKSTAYITYNAFGLAILRTHPYDAIKHLVADDFPKTTPTRSVVLIDEIDKAQRDFPNDILNEVEEMSFKIAELNNVNVKADESMRPVLILTSNSEKHLPDAFLRRCIYYHIPFPEGKNLQAIVESRLSERIKNKNPFLKAALELFEKLRLEPLQKKPATAELLNWLMVLTTLYPKSNNPLAENRQKIESSIFNTLIKNKDDIAMAKHTLESWKP